MGVSKNSDTPKWMVYNGHQSLLKIDDLGGGKHPYFWVDTRFPPVGSPDFQTSPGSSSSTTFLAAATNLGAGGGFRRAERPNATDVAFFSILLLVIPNQNHQDIENWCCGNACDIEFLLKSIFVVNGMTMNDWFPVVFADCCQHPRMKIYIRRYCRT